MDFRKTRTQRVAAGLVVALLAVALPLLLAPDADAAASFDCRVVIADDDVVVLFSGEDVGTTANLRNQNEWLATVTGETRYVVADGAGDTYEVVLNDVSERVGCSGGVPVDYSCASTTQVGNELLTFWGEAVGTTANLFGDNRFAGTVTGQDAVLATGGAGTGYAVWLNDHLQYLTCNDSAPSDYACSSLAHGNDTTLYFWGDDVPSTAAVSYSPQTRLGEVTGQDELFVPGGATARHHVRLPDLRNAVDCGTTVTSAFSCSVFNQDGQATLAFEGSALGTAANVLRNGEWINNVTGQTRLVTSASAGDRFVVKLHTLQTAIVCDPTTTPPAPAPAPPVPTPAPPAPAPAPPAPTPAPPAPAPAPPAPSGPQPVGQGGDWDLQFEDNFDGNSLDVTVWEPVWFDNGGFQRPVNDREDACYHADSVVVQGGYLRLSISEEDDPGCVNKDGGPVDYVGAQITTRPWREREGFQTTDGYFEARMFLPRSNGDLHNWPAFWINGRNWPSEGELDVMEGLRERQPCASFHWLGDGHEHQKYCPSPAWEDPGGWHTFAADWTDGALSYYYDGELLATVPDGIVTNEPHFMSLQYTVNDEWGDPVTDTMLVDYVRVWRRAAD